MGLSNLIVIVGVAFLVVQKTTAIAREPCICPANYDPVCASDGKTYSNECELNCEKRYFADLIVFTSDDCDEVEREPCICTADYNPVCGSNGKTYSNECALNCDQKQFIHLSLFKTGEC